MLLSAPINILLKRRSQLSLTHCKYATLSYSTLHCTHVRDIDQHPSIVKYRTFYFRHYHILPTWTIITVNSPVYPTFHYGMVLHSSTYPHDCCPLYAISFRCILEFATLPLSFVFAWLQYDSISLAKVIHGLHRLFHWSRCVLSRIANDRSEIR